MKRKLDKHQHFAQARWDVDDDGRQVCVKDTLLLSLSCRRIADNLCWSNKFTVFSFSFSLFLSVALFVPYPLSHSYFYCHSCSLFRCYPLSPFGMHNWPFYTQLKIFQVENIGAHIIQCLQKQSTNNDINLWLLWTPLMT